MKTHTITHEQLKTIIKVITSSQTQGGSEELANKLREDVMGIVLTYLNEEKEN